MVTRRRYLSSTVCHSHLIQTRGTASAVLGDKRKRSLLACILQQLLPVNHMSPLGSPLPSLLVRLQEDNAADTSATSTSRGHMAQIKGSN